MGVQDGLPDLIFCQAFIAKCSLWLWVVDGQVQLILGQINFKPCKRKKCTAATEAPNCFAAYVQGEEREESVKMSGVRL